MELKFRQSRLYSQSLARSNRTFMELKSRAINEGMRLDVCSNRTFMELKLAGYKEPNLGRRVLIIPLWN